MTLRCPVVELRRYTLHDGRRDELITLFEREFVETQEATGMTLIGQFRDLDDPNRFVWLRGFPDMARRAAALHDFYGGPVWQRHRDRANATMVDSDDVLLLRPLDDRSGFPAPTGVRPPADVPPATGPARPPSPVVVATICRRTRPVDAGFADLFRHLVAPALTEAGGAPLACLGTEYAENTFPALPVRTGEHVVVWFSRFADVEHLETHLRRLDRSVRWQTEVLPELTATLDGAPERLRLVPTARSALR